jgi:hypothetical protein
VIQYFLDNDIKFDPRYVYSDISGAISHVHRYILHNKVLQDYPKYLEPAPNLGPFLKRLKAAGKQLFILTNSPWKCKQQTHKQTSTRAEQTDGFLCRRESRHGVFAS